MAVAGVNIVIYYQKGLIWGLQTHLGDCWQKHKIKLCHLFLVAKPFLAKLK